MTSYRICDIADGVPRPTQTDSPEAVACLIRDGLTRDVYKKAEKILEEWCRQDVEKARLSKIQSEKMAKEQQLPVNRFAKAIRHRDAVPQLLMECESTFSLNDLKQILRELPPMPRDSKSYARDWLTTRIAHVQSQQTTKQNSK